MPRYPHSTLHLILVCLYLILMTACTEPSSSRDFVDDPADLLTGTQLNRISELSQKLLEDFDIHFLTITLAEPSTDLNNRAIELFDTYALGQKTRGARGMLLIVDPLGKAVRLETGYDLEGIFTDAFTGYIEREQMAPFFKAGKVGPGIEATVELIVAKVIQAIERGDYVIGQGTGALGKHLSGGGGAKSDIEISDKPPDKSVSWHSKDFNPRPTPLEALRSYMQVLELHIKDPDLYLYTPETRDFFRKWVVTNAQQDNELKGLKKSLPDAHTHIQGGLAVIRFPIGDRHTAPYFLRKDDNGWMLDFNSMSRLIRFNHKNQWHFVRTDHEFIFAYTDVRFDKHGFPHK